MSDDNTGAQNVSPTDSADPAAREVDTRERTTTEKTPSGSAATARTGGCSGHSPRPVDPSRRAADNGIDHRLVTDGGEGVDLPDIPTDAAIGRGHIVAARAAGAHDQFVAYVAEYPNSRVAETLETAVALDALDEFEGVAGSNSAALWRDGVTAATNADPERAEKFRALFPTAALPETLRGSDGDDETPEPVTDGGQRVDPTELTEFRVQTLRAIAVLGGEEYGLAIKRQLEAHYGQDVNHGRLYPNLDTLVQWGLVEKSELDKRTNSYALTSRGIRVLESRLDDLADAVDALHAEREPAVADGGDQR